MTDPLDVEVDLSHPLTGCRIAVLATPFPRGTYPVAVLVGDTGLEPTPQEAAELADYLEHRLAGLSSVHRAMLAAAGPFDSAPDLDSHIFRRHPRHGWQYRSSTLVAQVWFPHAGIDEARFSSLAALLAHITTAEGATPAP